MAVWLCKPSLSQQYAGIFSTPDGEPWPALLLSVIELVKVDLSDIFCHFLPPQYLLQVGTIWPDKLGETELPFTGTKHAYCVSKKSPSLWRDLVLHHRPPMCFWMIIQYSAVSISWAESIKEIFAIDVPHEMLVWLYWCTAFQLLLSL